MSESEFDMVMPFVLVASRGGPYADDAYVAGYAMGLLDAELRIAEQFGMTPAPRALPPGDARQVDLIAMRYGFVVKANPHDENYTNYEFERSGS